MSSQSFHLFAPAKLNLFLHVTGKRADGYHLLQSIMAFVDVGDDLVFFKDDIFSIEATGPFASALGASEDNLIYKAAQLLSRHYKVPLSGKVILTKNLPVASGIGGGSSDAAAALKGFVRLWKLPDEQEVQQQLAQKLGADVLACFLRKPSWVEGIGEKIICLPAMPEMYLVLVNPLVPTPTPQVFKNFHPPFTPPGVIWHEQMTVEGWIEHLRTCTNDLTDVAIVVTPIIQDVLKAVADTPACLVSRLSGSGASCFGIYKTKAEAHLAACLIKERYPAWWVVETAWDKAPS